MIATAEDMLHVTQVKDLLLIIARDVSLLDVTFVQTFW